MHRPSRFARAGRALVGLITVWCLGCSGYEPLLGSLLGADATSGMVCASDMTMNGASAEPSTDAAKTGAGDRAQVAAASDHRVFDCGCGSCHAASPAQWNVAVMGPALPLIVPALPTQPLDVPRVPLLPPPEFET